MSGGKKTEKINRLEAVIAQLESKINDLKGTNSVLEAWRSAWLHGLSEKAQINLQTTIGALTQLWQKLRVEHQTAAVIRIGDLLLTERAHKSQQDTELQHRQEVTKLTEDIRVYKLALRQAESDRDRLHNSHHDQGFDLTNSQSRIEELETAIREHLKECRGNSESHLSEYDYAFNDLAKVLGDEDAEV